VASVQQHRNRWRVKWRDEHGRVLYESFPTEKQALAAKKRVEAQTVLDDMVSGPDTSDGENGVRSASLALRRSGWRTGPTDSGALAQRIRWGQMSESPRQAPRGWSRPARPHRVRTRTGLETKQAVRRFGVESPGRRSSAWRLRPGDRETRYGAGGVMRASPFIPPWTGTGAGTVRVPNSGTVPANPPRTEPRMDRQLCVTAFGTACRCALRWRRRDGWCAYYEAQPSGHRLRNVEARRPSSWGPSGSAVASR
jgi:hypothetical protein